jgi:hypothetical protein
MFLLLLYNWPNCRLGSLLRLVSPYDILWHYLNNGHLIIINQMDNFENLPDYAVLPFPKFVKLSGLSERTCRRICVPGGSGPPTIRLSERRLGVQVCDYKEWLKSRTRVV